MPKKLSGSVQIFYPRFNREQVIQAIHQGLENLGRELPLVLVVLFGSYAKGNYTVGSDIDLLVIYEKKGRKEAYSIVKRAFDIPNLEPHVYSEEEYRAMKDSIRAMLRQGIIIFQARKQI